MRFGNKSPKRPEKEELFALTKTLFPGYLQFERTGQKMLGNYTLVAINTYGIEEKTIVIDHQTGELMSD